MPRRRTKQSRSTTLLSDDSCHIDPEEVKLFDKDLDEQLKKVMAGLEKTANDITKELNHLFNRFLMTIPQGVLDMPYIAAKDSGGTILNALDSLNDVSPPPASFSNDANLIKSAKKKKIKMSRRPPESVCDSMSESDESTSSKEKSRKAKKTVTMGPPTNIRAPRFRTPAHLQQSSCVNDTPLVTPAFNPRLPKTPAVVARTRMTTSNGRTWDFKDIPVNFKNKEKGSVMLPVFTHDFDLDSVTIPDLDFDMQEHIRGAAKLLNTILAGQMKQASGR